MVRRLEFDGHELRFRPNALNRTLHKGDLEITIDRSEIVEVLGRRGFLTGLLLVRTSDEIFSFRVYGAPRASRTIEAAISGTSDDSDEEH